MNRTVIYANLFNETQDLELFQEISEKTRAAAEALLEF